MKDLKDFYNKYIQDLMTENSDYFIIRKKKELEVHSMNPYTKQTLIDMKSKVIDKIYTKKILKISAIPILKQIEKCIKTFDTNVKKNIHKIIDRNEYETIIKAFCKEAEDELIKGNKVSFGGKLGYFQILKQKRNTELHKLITDWKASNQVKREIIERGEIPMSKENPNGVPYIRHFPTDGFYYLVKWKKSKLITGYKYCTPAKCSTRDPRYDDNFKIKLIKAFQNPLAPLIYK